MMAIESQTTLKQAGFRVELDRGASPMENRRHECLGKMIRTAESKLLVRDTQLRVPRFYEYADPSKLTSNALNHAGVDEFRSNHAGVSWLLMYCLSTSIGAPPDEAT